MADEVPLDVLGQHGMFVAQLGGVVLAENTLTGRVCLTDVLDGLGLGNCDKANPFPKGGIDAREVFCNHYLMITMGI